MTIERIDTKRRTSIKRIPIENELRDEVRMLIGEIDRLKRENAICELSKFEPLVKLLGSLEYSFRHIEETFRRYDYIVEKYKSVEQSNQDHIINLVVSIVKRSISSKFVDIEKEMRDEFMEEARKNVIIDHEDIKEFIEECMREYIRREARPIFKERIKEIIIELEKPERQRQRKGA